MRDLFGLLLLASALLLGCPSDDDDSGSVGDDDDTNGEIHDGNLSFTQTHSYSYEGDLWVDVTALGAGQDVLVSWDQLTMDMRGWAIAGPEYIHSASLVGFTLTQQEVIEAITTNAMLESDVGGHLTFDNGAGGSSAMLSDFAIADNAFDPEMDFVVREVHWTWAVTLWSEMPDGRTEVRTVMFLKPEDDSENSEAAFTDGTATLDFQVDLHSADTLRTAAGLTYTLDWSGVTADPFGHAIDPAAVDQLVVGRAPVATLEETETNFLQHFDQSGDIYRLGVFGVTSTGLATATSLDGDIFPGFTADGVWLVGLQSLSSMSPAPLAVGVVEVVE